MFYKDVNGYTLAIMLAKKQTFKAKKKKTGNCYLL